jgi:hypothetical protein
MTFGNFFVLLLIREKFNVFYPLNVQCRQQNLLIALNSAQHFISSVLTLTATCSKHVLLFLFTLRPLAAFRWWHP